MGFSVGKKGKQIALVRLDVKSDGENSAVDALGVFDFDPVHGIAEFARDFIARPSSVKCP
jgi:hypothetical protein